MSAEKNAKIKSSIKATKERHKLMDCRTYEVKVVDSKLSRAQKDGANACFREAKWRRNDCVANWGNISRDKKSASVKVGDHFEERQFRTIGAQVVQDVYDEVKKNINELHDKKEKGYKVGKLKFKSVCDCVPLRQHGVTFTVDKKHNRVKVAKIKKPFYVRGLNQIPDDADIASAQLIRKPSGLYFHITVYEYPKDREKTGKQVGLDFGIEHNLTTTDWNYYDVDVPESKGLKLAQRRFNRSYVKNGSKKSNSHYKRLAKVKRAYEKMSNKREDAANKIVHQLLNDYDFIGIQDEMIHSWQAGLFGKQVQNSAMGTIKKRLSTNPRTVVVERSFPSTQLCPKCGCKTKHPLKKRTYDCAFCGYHHDSRDVKSAESILNEALRLSGTESVKSLAKVPVPEAESATPVSLDTGCKIPPVKPEAR